MKLEFVGYQSRRLLQFSNGLSRFPFSGKIEADEVIRLGIKAMEMHLPEAPPCFLIKVNLSSLPHPLLPVVVSTVGMAPESFLNSQDCLATPSHLKLDNPQNMLEKTLLRVLPCLGEKDLFSLFPLLHLNVEVT